MDLVVLKCSSICFGESGKSRRCGGSIWLGDYDERKEQWIRIPTKKGVSSAPTYDGRGKKGSLIKMFRVYKPEVVAHKGIDE